MSKIKSNYFYIRLLLLNIAIFIFHIIILFFFDIEIFSNKIIESYLINILTAALLYLLIDKYKHKFKDNIGYIFLFNSFIKFGLFAILIYPYYKLDGISTKIEFSTFFIPYVVCLVYETYYLIKLLNSLDYSKA